MLKVLNPRALEPTFHNKRSSCVLQQRPGGEERESETKWNAPEPLGKHSLIVTLITMRVSVVEIVRYHSRDIYEVECDG